MSNNKNSNASGTEIAALVDYGKPKYADSVKVRELVKLFQKEYKESLDKLGNKNLARLGNEDVYV